MIKAFSPNMNSDIKNKTMLEQIKCAIENKNIISHFQPIINNQTNEIEKYESLVRLINENNEVLLPNLFLGISKASNIYCEITKQVLENSFLILQENQGISISINLSMSDIENEEIQNTILFFLDKHSELGKRIIFELLEDERIINFKVISRFIYSIKKREVRIAIDDFGSGYSNFERIFRLAPDIIKIDGSIIGGLENNNYSRDLIESLVYFSKKQGIKTIGEWVESESTYTILRNIGVDYSQGYYFGKPAALKISKN